MTLPVKEATTAIRYLKGYSPGMPLDEYVRFFFSEEWNLLRDEPGEWRMIYCPQCRIPHGVRKGKVVRPFRESRNLKAIMCECGRSAPPRKEPVL